MLPFEYMNALLSEKNLGKYEDIGIAKFHWPHKQVEGRSWIYVQHVNLAFLGKTRKFTGHT